MRTRIAWTIGAACAMVAGLAILPAPAQDVKSNRPDPREVRSDRREGAADTGEVRKTRKDLQASSQQLREAYRSGDRAAIKAARENYQRTRSEVHADPKDRRPVRREPGDASGARVP